MRLLNANKTIRGYGLGLVIAKRCIEVMGGSISFSNHKQGGLVVRLNIPYLSFKDVASD